MGLLETIKAVNDLPTKKLHISEWDVDLWIKTMTCAERDMWEQGWLDYRKRINGDADDHTGFYAYLLTFVVVDESGKRLFAEADISWLMQKSTKVVTRIAKAATKLNGIGEADVDELLKN